MFPPYPFGADSSPARKHPGKKPALKKRTTVLQFGTFSIIFSSLLGSLVAVSPRGGPEACPRRPQGVPKASPRRPKGVPRRPKGVPKASKGVLRRPQGVPKACQGVPKASRRRLKASRCVPRRPKGVPKTSKGVREAPQCDEVLQARGEIPSVEEGPPQGQL